jgi:recombination protein RecT
MTTGAATQKSGNGEQTTTLATTDQATPKSAGPLATLMQFCRDPDTKRRMSEMLGQRAGAFLNSVINVVKNSKQLQDIARVNPASIMSAAMVAASVNLPIDPALGFAAIVPYAGKEPAAQFQLMYKGLIQLAIRSAQYERIHYTEVYRDEIDSYNPITGETKFTSPENWKMRADGKVEDVAGFYAFFRLKTGFEASKYISFEQAMAHGRRYSKSYQADIKYNKAVSLWSTDPLAMGGKTCLKMLVGKYGILSIEMQDAFVAESSDFAGDLKHVDSLVTEGPEIGGVEGLKARMIADQQPGESQANPPAESSGTATGSSGSAPSSGQEPEKEAPVDAPIAQKAESAKTETEAPAGHFKCNACGTEFAEPATQTAPGGEILEMCPHCEATNLVPVEGPFLATVECVKCHRQYAVKPGKCFCGSGLGVKTIKGQRR